MRVTRITVLAVAALIATPLTGVFTASTGSVSMGYSAEGTGPTLAAAQQNARKILQGDAGPCTGVFTYADGQGSDGTWWADVSGECAGPH